MKLMNGKNWDDTERPFSANISCSRRWNR
jgi:hypothetical protein